MFFRFAKLLRPYRYLNTTTERVFDAGMYSRTALPRRNRVFGVEFDLWPIPYSLTEGQYIPYLL